MAGAGKGKGRRGKEKTGAKRYGGGNRDGERGSDTETQS